MRPRAYISFSQMTTFEQDPDRFVRQYIYHDKQRVSRNMAYGSAMADGLEMDEATGDPMLDLVIARLPRFELMDKAVEDPKGTWITFKRGNREIKACVPILEDKKEQIPILALPDTAIPDYTAFKEYKTSVRRWTQRMADESGQITFYATAIWLAKGFIPDDIELVNAQVEYLDDGRIQPTGDILRFSTKRSMIDVIKMTSRIKKAWAGVDDLCKKELL